MWRIRDYSYIETNLRTFPLQYFYHSASVNRPFKINYTVLNDTTKATNATDLRNHAKTHRRNTSISTTVKLPSTDNRRVKDCAVDAVVHGLLSFKYSTPGIVSLTRVLIEVGETLPPSGVMNENDLLPSNQTVVDCVTRTASVNCVVLMNGKPQEISRVGRRGLAMALNSR